MYLTAQDYIPYFWSCDRLLAWCPLYLRETHFPFYFAEYAITVIIISDFFHLAVTTIIMHMFMFIKHVYVLIEGTSVMGRKKYVLNKGGP